MLLKKYPLFLAAALIQSVSFLIYGLQLVISIFGYPHIHLSYEQHELIEVLGLFGLLIGAIISWVVVFRMADRTHKVEEQLNIVSGSFQSLVMEKCDEWGFTKTEKDVALMIIKGLSISETATVLGKSEGTIKSHSSEIYRKSGLSNRLQFATYFMEELTINF